MTTVLSRVMSFTRWVVPLNFPPRRWWRLRRLGRTLAPLRGQQLLRAFAKAYPRAFFIQIGANDATQQDPLHYTRQVNAWSGILVEPVPYVFERLKRNCGDLPHLVLENVAIADRDGPLPFHHLAPAKDGDPVPGWYDGLGSFSRETVLKHIDYIPDIERRLVTTEVPCLTFESLCRKHGVTTIDVVHIDAEGYDAQIVNQIDLVRRRPRLLIYEHFHLDAGTRASLHERLERAGYEWMEEYLDTWCLDTSAQTDASVLARWRELKAAPP